jgi:hypothetical protein
LVKLAKYDEHQDEHHDEHHDKHNKGNFGDTWDRSKSVPDRVNDQVPMAEKNLRAPVSRKQCVGAQVCGRVVGGDQRWRRCVGNVMDVNCLWRCVSLTYSCVEELANSA